MATSTTHLPLIVPPSGMETSTWRERIEAAQTRALAKKPYESQRIALGAWLALQGAVERIAPGRYTVASQDTPDTWYDIAKGTCTCPDYERKAATEEDYRCKHVYAVYLWRDAQGGLPPEPVYKSSCTPVAQTPEPDRFPEPVQETLPAVRGTMALVSQADLGQAIASWTATRRLIAGYIQQHFRPGVDYYTLKIQGRETKPSLSKAGSEKFLSLFQLQASFEKDSDTWEMLGCPAGVLCYVCHLTTASGQLVGEGRGARDIKKDGGDVNKAIKMAEKAAMVDAILRTGALSDQFTQDLEER